MNEEQPKSDDSLEKIKSKIEYKIHEKPPALLSFLLGFQQFLTMIGGCIAYPYVVSTVVCMKPDDLNKIYLMQTVFLTSGFATLMQLIFGVKLPLIQGPSLTFLIPLISILDLPGNQCPSHEQLNNMTDTQYHDLWSNRLREIQGSVMIVGFVCFLCGCFGLIGRVLHLISPVIIGPTIIQLGLSFAKVSMKEASKSWSFSILTIVLMIIFTQYIDELYILFPRFGKLNVKNGEQIESNQNEINQNEEESSKQSRFAKIYLFRLFPVVCTILTVWSIAAIGTFYNLIPVGSEARVDGEKIRLMFDSPFFYLPTPFQWGMPKFSSKIILGIASAMIVCVTETIGNYFACAQLSEGPSPPKHAINRGVAMEGLACFVSGLFGTGGGNTSYSENISCIAMTRVASRRVVLNAAVIMIVISFFAKVCGFFSTMPSPIIGGVLFIVCSIITAVGISIVSVGVNMHATRNLFIIGISLFSGLCLPEYFKIHSKDINFSIAWLDQFLTILVTNPLIITLLIAFILDNTIKLDHPNDRGLHKWLQADNANSLDPEKERIKNLVYDLPGPLARIRGKKLSKILPIFPNQKNLNLSSRSTTSTYPI